MVVNGSDGQHGTNTHSTAEPSGFHGFVDMLTLRDGPYKQPLFS